MKAALILLDGLADRSQKVLGMRTPLAAARTPNLDRLAQLGSCGHFYPIQPGAWVGSALSTWEVLGYGSHPFPGRAGLELLGAGVELKSGDVAFRVDLATTMVDEGRRYVQVAPAFLPDEQAARLFASLERYEPSSLAARLYHPGGPFMAMVLSGGADPHVTDSDPVFFRLPVSEIRPLASGSPAAAETAAELNRFISWAAEVLEGHEVNASRERAGMTPINSVLVKWPSVRPAVPSFSSVWGFDAASFTSGLFLKGLAVAMSMSVPDDGSGIPPAVEPLAGDPEEDLGRKLEAALEALAGGRDFVFLHSSAAEEASRSGKPRRKVRVIEQLDSALAVAVDAFAPDEDLLTVVTCGHSTPSGGSEYVFDSGESVPVVMTGANTRVDGVEGFDEVACCAGALGLFRGADLMPLILNFTDRGAHPPRT